MSWNRKVIWSEGMLLQPQHLQQHDRYLMTQLEARAGRLRAYASSMKRDITPKDEALRFPIASKQKPSVAFT